MSAARFCAISLGLSGLLATGLTSAAGAETSFPTLELMVASPRQTVERYPDQPVNIAELGYYMIAGDEPVEFRTGRQAFSEPVRTTMLTGDKRRSLPDSLTESVNTLTGMFDLTVKNRKEKNVFSQKIDFCPNSGRASRSRRHAPASSPYPQLCGVHPFARGATLGISSGWSTPVLNDAWDAEPLLFTGPSGTYTARMTMAEPYRQALGVPAAKASAVITFTVVDAATEPMAAMVSGHHHASTSAPGRRPAMTISRPSAQSRFTDQAPDLRSLPAYDIDIDTKKVEKQSRTYVNFAATVWNAGPTPLVVDGFRRQGTGLMDAYQYFFDGHGNEVGSMPAGTLEWDARNLHHHWHFTAFAQYDLLDESHKLVTTSGKEAFCLAATDPIDTSIQHAKWQPKAVGLDAACGQENSLSIREALDVGWGDTYDQRRPGQSFDVTTLPGGTYFIRVAANPAGTLVERTRTNNTALRKIRVTGKPGGKRALKVYPYEGISN